MGHTMKSRLLIVDDELEIRETLARYFRLKSFDTATAENGKAALAKLEAQPFQVIISDIMMPVMDGIELLRTVRSEYPMTRVIIITGYVTIGNALACMRHGADTVVFKPLDDLSKLENAVAEAIRYLQHWEKIMMELRGMGPLAGGVA